MLPHMYPSALVQHGLLLQARRPRGTYQGSGVNAVNAVNSLQSTTASSSGSIPFWSSLLSSLPVYSLFVISSSGHQPPHEAVNVWLFHFPSF